MNDLEQNLKTEFRDEDFRYAYAESFLNTKLATQIKTLREQRAKTQAEVAAKIGIKQPGYRRFEDVNHSVWKTDSLWSIARANGVRVNISFETFGSLLDEKKRFTKEVLQRPEFEDDPVFNEPERQPVVQEVATGPQALSRYASINTSGTTHDSAQSIGDGFTHLVSAPQKLRAQNAEATSQREQAPACG